MKKALSILALMTDAFGGRGGIAQYNRDFLIAVGESLACAETVVLVRNAADTVALPLNVVQREPVRGRVGYSLTAVYQALRRRFDIVFCGHLFQAPLAYAIARLLRARLVIQIHGIEAWTQPNFLTRFAVERADLILCVSRYTRARVLDWAAIRPERARVLPNTVAECFTPGSGAALRQEWDLKGRTILLTVGRMSANERYKGQDRVIQALPALIAAGHDVVYVIAGEGDDIGRLKNVAATNGMADRVRFIGSVDSKTLIEAYRAADLFVMPSTKEGFGIAFLEAMACGTPVVGLNVAGARDALADGALGVLTDQQTLVGGISEALACSKVNPDVLHRAVRARFGHEAFRASVSAIFTELSGEAA